MEFEKLVDFSLEKLKIAKKFKMTAYKVEDLDDFKMLLTVYKTRTFDQENYLGDTAVPLKAILESPKEWAVN